LLKHKYFEDKFHKGRKGWKEGIKVKYIYYLDEGGTVGTWSDVAWHFSLKS